MSRGSTVSLARQKRLPWESVVTRLTSRYRLPTVTPGEKEAPAAAAAAAAAAARMAPSPTSAVSEASAVRSVPSPARRGAAGVGPLSTVTGGFTFGVGRMIRGGGGAGTTEPLPAPTGPTPTPVPAPSRVARPATAALTAAAGGVTAAEPSVVRLAGVGVGSDGPAAAGTGGELLQHPAAQRDQFLDPQQRRHRDDDDEADQTPDGEPAEGLQQRVELAGSQTAQDEPARQRAGRRGDGHLGDGHQRAAGAHRAVPGAEPDLPDDRADEVRDRRRRGQAGHHQVGAEVHAQEQQRHPHRDHDRVDQGGRPASFIA